MNVAAEGQLRTLPRTVAYGWLPLMPFCAGEKLEQALDLRRQARRSDGSRQNTETTAVGDLNAGSHGGCRIGKLLPVADFAQESDRLCAVRVVQIKYRGLRKSIRCAQAAGMVGVALNFGRTAFMALHQNAERIGAGRHRRSEKQRIAGNHAVRLLDVGNNMLLRRSASRHPRERERCAHQLQKIAPVNGVVPLGSMPREFAVHEFLESRVLRELLDGTPILLAALRLQLGA